jgi:hypothetical protein
MLPEAYLSHLTGERLRIKIPSKKGNTAYFLSLKDQLSQFSKLPGVQKIEVNPLTGSILVLHTLDLKTLDVQSIAQYTEINGLFRLKLPVTDQTPASLKLGETLSRMNTKIKGFTGGEIDISTLGILGFLGVAIFQMRRGHVMIPAITALWYAATLLKEQQETKTVPERTKIKVEEG